MFSSYLYGLLCIYLRKEIFKIQLLYKCKLKLGHKI